MEILNRNQTPDRPRYISHRGFTPLAPENSLPAFSYAGLLGQWAIETDVRVTRDGMLVCCHNAGVEAMYGEPGLIREMRLQALSRLRIRTGSRVECFPEEALRMPLFAQYLAICRRYGCVPFIELKTGDAERVVRAVRDAGFCDEEVVMSASCLAWLEETRAVAPGMFLHHIFGNEAGLQRLSAMGNAGMSWKVDDPLARPVALVQMAHEAGIRVCLRAADSLEAVRVMLGLGLDYLPTNRMHGGCPGREAAPVRA